MITAQALIRGWGDLLRPQILGLVARGIGLTLALLVLLQGLIFWMLRSFVGGSLSLPWWGEITIGPLLGWASLALFPVLGFFLMAPVAAAFSGLYAGTVSARVETIHYPSRQGQETDFWDSFLESLPVIGGMLLIGVICLIAMPVLGPFAPVLFYGANGWLLGREFFQMAARRHLDPDRASALRIANRPAVIALGIMIALALTVPVLNIAVPVLAAASFTHLFHFIAGSAGPSPSHPRG
ncbi:MAG: EI24 domain-containing protein [Paracoccus sp. (in: a-proteobacteria)]|nr:EI24 domain-containing protein [Paracoccus sp. (in: a-proteobacteria)]